MMMMITSATSKEILTADVTQQEGIEFVAMMISKLWANCELLKWKRIRHFIFRNRRNCERGTCCSECEDEDDRSCNLCDDRERDCRQLKSKRLFNNKFSRSRTQKLLFEAQIVKVNTPNYGISASKPSFSFKPTASKASIPFICSAKSFLEMILPTN